jgi:hypothetical protein
MLGAFREIDVFARFRCLDLGGAQTFGGKLKNDATI